MTAPHIAADAARAETGGETRTGKASRPTQRCPHTPFPPPLALLCSTLDDTAKQVQQNLDVRLGPVAPDKEPAGSPSDGSVPVSFRATAPPTVAVSSAPKDN
eukprot:CAMPEP_0194338072 /NCGR_PEP_ID=MMETSP0171-20130528/78304_1 /TAXON_ID=218684 /ORGANISM="Corethron pennatum, Strain L29A3" /LENGTH=101 /DNA_ID=CAMNT_0039102071 /DNA_START=235 /DNA_END=542 /DNA_ORIENTATION=-